MIDREKVLAAIQEARKLAKHRNFVQSFDLMVNLRDYDIRKDGKIYLIVELPHGRGKPVTVAAFVDTDVYDKAKEVFDKVILKEEIPKLAQNKRECKKLVRRYDFFVAEASVMPVVATYLGKYLAAKDKVPNPKFGMVFTPSSDIAALAERLRRSVKLSARKQPCVYTAVGTETMKNEEVADNILAVLNALIEYLPRREHNIDSVYLKLTMGPAVRVV